MLYFNKVILAEIDGTKVEAAILKFAAKRHASLDLQSSATKIGTEKLFLGLENEKSIQVTRLRSTFERFLPKLIIRFDKAKGFSEYRIRFSLLSNIVIAFISNSRFKSQSKEYLKIQGYFFGDDTINDVH